MEGRAERSGATEETGQGGALPAAAPEIGGGVFGRTVEGRPIRYVRFGRGTDITLVFGAIHGNEPASELLALGLVFWLERQTALDPQMSVIVVPALNSDGLAANSRYNANGVDLNRNFPAENRRSSDRYGHEGLSEPESRALAGLIGRYPPARIISIHQPLACIDYDGPGEGMAAAMAAEGALSVRKLGARPGSFGSWAGVDQGIPTVTLELRRGDEHHSIDQLWQMYGSTVLAGLFFKI